jgi:putative ubiquitin-RnfH superfamily antitoxin RatB of RatAB toxin-antitoxin module
VVYATQQENKLTSITFKRGNTVIATILGSQLKANSLTVYTA